MLKRLFSHSARSRVTSQSSSLAASPQKPRHRDWNTNDAFFQYTRGRFVVNEAHEMDQRHIQFNMNELAKVAVESIGATECVQIEKCADGMYNKTFLFTMQDGSQIIGKVPNPNAGRAFFTTASEVATMDFVGNVLNTPVPKVLAWNSHAEKSSVGAEYIIMEKAQGVQLSEIWPSMDLKARFEVTKTLFKHQKSWMSHSFTQYGSLYYANDLSQQNGCTLIQEDGTRIEQSRFAIGPSTGRADLDEERINVDFDRGPWNTVDQYKRAVALREMTCIKATEKLPSSPITLHGPSAYVPTHAKKLTALQYYLDIMGYMLPTDESISVSTLWHCDLHTENIFVDPNRPSEILSIIDWQSTVLWPLFDQARQPYFLDYEGPALEGLERPKLPENFKDLSQTEQNEATILYQQMSHAALYRILVHGKSPRLYRAMEYRESVSFDMLCLAQSILVDGEALYRAQVLELEEQWPDLPGVQAAGNLPFPIHPSPEEIESLEQDVDGTLRGMQMMNEVRKMLGDLMPVRGLVRIEQYDEAKLRLREARDAIIGRLDCTEEEHAAWIRAWPFEN